MKVLILAGGLGTRLAEETDRIPKPMVEIGNRPILWHIMRHYGQAGFKEFVVALGYRGDVVKRFMLDYRALSYRNVKLNMATGDVELADGDEPLDWEVNLLETGLHTQTSGRVRRALSVIGNERFMLTYGDGVSDVNLKELLAFHESHGKLVTISIVKAKSLFGHLSIEGSQITEFVEKPQELQGWINGGFMIMEPGVAEYLGDDDMPLERSPFERLAQDGQMMAFRHHGFWQCMDSLRDMRLLETLWDSGAAPWKTWE